ncbi:MAG: TRAM domain-containing protein [Phycisphaerales bacterium]|nr:TRAM domain-containing protein [Phycisphaerales bacterium]
MLQHFLRLFLVLALLAVGMSFAEEGDLVSRYQFVLIVGMLVLAVVVVAIEIFIPQKSLQALSGLFFGLVVGLLVAYGFSVVLDLLVSAFFPNFTPIDGKDRAPVAITKVLLGIICCYYCVSFVLQTKDDIRFVIPYVEFAKQIKGNRPVILDTSVIIDGRIAEICDTGFIDQRLIIPRFVLHELQAVADSNDKLKRTRGRRGLDVLNKLQSKTNIDLEILEPQLSKLEASEPVDLKLLAVAKQVNGRVATNDYNLNKIGQLRNVDILNINDLANALKPIALPGEAMSVKIIKAGEEAGQGIGYLDDGTMVVIEQGRNRIGEVVDIAVTSVLQTSAGRMIFGRIEGGASGGSQDRRRGAPSRPKRPYKETERANG